MTGPQPNGIERRRCPRRALEPGEPLSRVRLRTGSEMTMVDVSDAGTLVEGDSRLLPGTHVDAHILTRAGRVLVRSRVVRAFVSHVQSDQVRYRGALAFDRKVDTGPHGYSIPGAVGVHTGALGTPYPETTVAPGDHVDKSL